MEPWSSRPYDPERDREAVRRIWREVGWLRKGQERHMDLWLQCSRAVVGELEGEAECLVVTTPGAIRYLSEDLPLAAVTGVTTSRVARKLGMAGALTARSVAAEAAEGALVAGLGMFEQGYYNRLGFGTGGYETWVSLDPSALRVDAGARRPLRITGEDWEAVHAARLSRLRGHGGCNLAPPETTRAEMGEEEGAFGLGYRDGARGELTHFVWCAPESDRVELGPYKVQCLVYQTNRQLLELLALLKSLGDQVRLFTLREPAGVQLQDLVDRPFRRYDSTKGSEYENHAHAVAYWQMRLCDLPGCLARTHLPGRECRFSLRLQDPIEPLLKRDGLPWTGVGGDYVVALGKDSWAERGYDPSLPTLEASVGAFTRLWLGVRPASGLAVTDDLSGPPELLEQLDWALCLPPPKPDWDF